MCDPRASCIALMGREKALLWLQSLNLVSKSYHDEAFEGNACSKLLKASDKLLNHIICQDIGYRCRLYQLSQLSNPKIIVHSCFGVKSNSDLKPHIKDLKTALLAINVMEF